MINFNFFPPTILGIDMIDVNRSRHFLTFDPLPNIHYYWLRVVISSQLCRRPFTDSSVSNGYVASPESSCPPSHPHQLQRSCWKDWSDRRLTRVSNAIKKNTVLKAPVIVSRYTGAPYFAAISAIKTVSLQLVVCMCAVTSSRKEINYVPILFFPLRQLVSPITVTQSVISQCYSFSANA